MNTGRTHFKKGNHPVSEFKKGNKIRVGMKHSKETKEKIKLKKIGQKWSGEQRIKMRGHGGKLIHGLSKTKEYAAVIEQNRRARKRENGGSHTLGEWQILKAQYNWTCLCCKRSEPEIKLVQDHIIPIIKGGSNNIENIQPLCGSCNNKKYIKIIKYELD